MASEDLCAECNFPLDSQEHLMGRGLHGHTRTSKTEADEQRAEVMARARAFAENAQREELMASVATMSEDQLAALAAALAARGVAVAAPTRRAKGN